MTGLAQGALKFADQNSKDIVSGYCKEIEKSLISKQIIPKYIIDICLAYYLIIERFIECGNKYIKFDQERRSITNPVSKWDTAYGTFEIDCNDKLNIHKLYRWTFDIYNNGYGCNSIGIDETKRKWVNAYFKFQKDTINYSYTANGVSDSSKKRQSENLESYKNGDRIIMVLNMDDQTLIYYKCKQSEEDEINKREVCKFENVKTKDVKYCMAVYIWHCGSVKLINFCIECK